MQHARKTATASLIEASGGLMPAIDSNDRAGWYAAIRRMADDHAWAILAGRAHRKAAPADTGIGELGRH
ncbi:hypothetical protein [Mesorhizobium sp. B2-4-12]|uniref:hypothetical protein n=1 Tax=Mesorhizobium sp. B2-4-12 TaxID=2589937 RepID=UPI001FEF91CF|nr:hypothetical protein [Mesorhizobium sp. B2-4-12]